MTITITIQTYILLGSYRKYSPVIWVIPAFLKCLHYKTLPQRTCVSSTFQENMSNCHKRATYILQDSFYKRSQQLLESFTEAVEANWVHLHQHSQLSLNDLLLFSQEKNMFYICLTINLKCIVAMYFYCKCCAHDCLRSLCPLSFLTLYILLLGNC